MILSDGFEEKKGKAISNLNLKSFISDHVSDISSCKELQIFSEMEEKPRREKRTYLNLTDGKPGIFAYGDSCLIVSYGLWDGIKLHDRLSVFDFDSKSGKLTPVFQCLTNPEFGNPVSTKKCSALVRSLVKQFSAYLFREDAKDYIIQVLERVTNKSK